MNRTFTANIAFTVTEPINSTVVEISQKVRYEFGSDWWIDNERYHLHLPVFLLECPEKNRQKLLIAGEDYSKNIRELDVEIIDMKLSESGLIMLIFYKSQKLEKLHLKALELFNNVREGCLREKYQDESNLSTFTAKQIKKIKKYGHIWVEEFYSPHITIARIKDTKIANKVIDKYSKTFIGMKAQLKTFEILESTYGEDDRTIVLFEKDIN